MHFRSRDLHTFSANAENMSFPLWYYLERMNECLKENTLDGCFDISANPNYKDTAVLP